jgi:hypothetical protein
MPFTLPPNVRYVDRIRDAFRRLGNNGAASGTPLRDDISRESRSGRSCRLSQAVSSRWSPRGKNGKKGNAPSSLRKERTHGK